MGLTVFAVILAMAAALTAPFLWHTGESDGDGEQGERTEQVEQSDQGQKKDSVERNNRKMTRSCSLTT